MSGGAEEVGRYTVIQYGSAPGIGLGSQRVARVLLVSPAAGSSLPLLFLTLD